MTREQAKKYAPLIQAFGEGETIQVKTSIFGWLDCLDEKESMPYFHDGEEYRIKPKPRQFYICQKGAVEHALTPKKFLNSNLDFVNDGWEIIYVEETNFDPYK